MQTKCKQHASRVTAKRRTLQGNANDMQATHKQHYDKNAIRAYNIRKSKEMQTTCKQNASRVTVYRTELQARTNEMQAHGITKYRTHVTSADNARTSKEMQTHKSGNRRTSMNINNIPGKFQQAITIDLICFPY